MASSGSPGDVFLKVESARQGPIKGEAQDEKYKDHIEVVQWTWGMRAQTTIAGGTAGKATLNELVVSKHIDCASTSLMSAMRNNELIKSAVIIMRKSGGTQHEFCKVTIKEGRITSIDVRCDEPGSSSYTETLTFAFQSVRVEFIPQGADGQPRGAMQFEAEIS